MTAEDGITLTWMYALLNTKVTHKIIIYTILDIISNFGGLYLTFVLPTFALIGSTINNNMNIGKLLRS